MSRDNCPKCKSENGDFIRHLGNSYHHFAELDQPNHFPIAVYTIFADC